MRTRVKICGITRREDAELAVELGASALGFNFYPRSPRYLAPASAAQIIAKLPPTVIAVGVFADEADAAHVATVASEARVSTLQLHGPSFPAICGDTSNSDYESRDGTEGRAAEGRGFSPAATVDVDLGALAPGAESEVRASTEYGLQRLKPIAPIEPVSAGLKPRPSKNRTDNARGTAWRPYPVIRAIAVDAGFEPESLRCLKAAAFLLDAFDPVRIGGTGRTIDWTKAREATRYGRVILAGGLTPENVGEAIRQVRPFAVDVASGVEASPGVKHSDKLRAFFAAVEEADRA